MKKTYISLLFSIFFSLGVLAQEIKVEANNQALSEILVQISKEYNISVSFDDHQLSKYFLTLYRNFQSPEATFDFLIKDLPLNYEKTASVFLFYSKEKSTVALRSYILSGKVYDLGKHESLPYANILINGEGSISDEFGNFNTTSVSDSLFHIQVSYLGYSVIDTTLIYGANHRIGLSSRVVHMNEVEVKANPLYFSSQTGSEAGLLRINHKIAQFIPGNGDNSVFNILRLQPGILAAGEQSSEMIIWGSYQGQSQVNFDGITLFGLKNFNDNISTVNPNMAKDIRIHKGGYDATIGERVGGIVDISGIEGNKKKTAANLTLNNMTMNALVEVPLSRKLALVGAYRQTYYDLYSPIDVAPIERSATHFSENAIVVNPNYIFRDGNLKFSGLSNNSDSYHISTFWGQDHFSYALNQEHNSSTIIQNLDEKNRQFGARANYNKIWKGKGSSNLTISYSALQRDAIDQQSSALSGSGSGGGMGSGGMGSGGSGDGMGMREKELHSQNDISELKMMITGVHRLFKKHQLEYGSGLIHNSSYLQELTVSTTLIDFKEQGSQWVNYLQDRFSPNKYFNLRFGLHHNYAQNIKKSYFQPRLSISFLPSDKFRLNASWGLYNQFIVHNLILDENNNYRYQWRLSNGDDIPVLESEHFVLGGVYNNKGFTLGVESYYKKTDGITRQLASEANPILYKGNSKAKGVDLFIKQEFKGHSIWLSYSLSETLEWFSFFESDKYERAIHDQRHEFKIAGILNLSPFYFSGNFVWGSGFPNSTISSSVAAYPYSRVDIAAVYRFHIKKIKLETGFSILNLLNHENIKYSDIVSVPVEGESAVNIYSESIPFTPTLFLNISI